MKKTALITFVLVCSISLKANISLPAIWGDHMVLQQDSEVNLWGWGHPLEKVIITSSWSKDTIITTVDNHANWSVKLSTPKAGSDHSITIQGYNTLSIKDILIGEVWLLSGQSNMEWTANAGITGGEEAIKKAIHKQIRFFTVTKRASQYPCNDMVGKWVVCTPETMPHFSAIGYFFGEKLEKTLNIPVGLICSSWGGTPIEAWTPGESIHNNPALAQAAAKITEVPWGPTQIEVIYNAMIHPLLRYTIAGALWYQGEANTENADSYSALLSNMIESWREKFNLDFPFYYAQIAPFNGYGEDHGVRVREEQRRALDTPGTGMIVLSDIGDTTNIHPRNKIDAGNRFADMVLNQSYGRKEFPISGPLYASSEIDKNKIIVTFKYSKGLHCTDKTINYFEIADTQGQWHPAKAHIKNETVILFSSKVKHPTGARLGWSNSATPHLFNSDALPASCFTTKF